MAGSGDLRDLGWDLRRDWLSRLHAAANRTAPRRTGCHFDFLAFVYGVTSDQRLGDSRNGADCAWCRRTAGSSRTILRIVDSWHDRPHPDGHRPVSLLVDWDSWRLWRATDQSDRCR